MFVFCSIAAFSYLLLEPKYWASEQDMQNQGKSEGVTSFDRSVAEGRGLQCLSHQWL